MKKKSIAVLERTKEDYKDLESFLLRNEIIDERKLWFAGFDDSQRAEKNAVAANLLYGNSKLRIVTVCDGNIYFLINSKEGFSVYHFSYLQTGNYVDIRRNVLYPSIEITNHQDEKLLIKVTKNKSILKELTKAINLGKEKRSWDYQI